MYKLLESELTSVISYHLWGIEILCLIMIFMVDFKRDWVSCRMNSLSFYKQWEILLYQIILFVYNHLDYSTSCMMSWTSWISSYPRGGYVFVFLRQLLSFIHLAFSITHWYFVQCIINCRKYFVYQLCWFVYSSYPRGVGYYNHSAVSMSFYKPTSWFLILWVKSFVYFVP